MYVCMYVCTHGVVYVYVYVYVYAYAYAYVYVYVYVYVYACVCTHIHTHVLGGIHIWGIWGSALLNGVQSRQDHLLETKP